MALKPPHSSRVPSKRRPGLAQRGVSLVELLVGVAIGLLVTLAALGVVSFTRMSSTTVSDTVRLQQNASFIMRVVGMQLRQARSVAPVTSQQDAANGSIGYGAYQGTIPPGGAVEVAVFGTEGGANPDSITISTGSLPNLTFDCLGFEQLPSNTIVSTLQINAGSLSCQTPANNQPMVGNVEDLQIWYGVRNPATGNVQYLDANQATAAGWTTVGTVMVCVRLAGTSQMVPNLAGNNFLGCQNEIVPWDGRVRRVFRRVFTLRNLA